MKIWRKVVVVAVVDVDVDEPGIGRLPSTTTTTSTSTFGTAELRGVSVIGPRALALRW